MNYNSVQPTYLIPEQYRNLPDDKKTLYLDMVRSYNRVSGLLETEHLARQVALVDQFNDNVRIMALDLPTVGLGSDSSDLNSSLASIPQEEAVLSQTKDLPM